MAEQKMFRVEVWGYSSGFAWVEDRALSRKFYLFRFQTLFCDPDIKSDARFHPIGLAIAEMEFSEQIEIVLGLFISDPLFIKIRQIGNLSFSELDNEKNEGFLMFGGNAKILMKKDTKEIRREFFEQLMIFLKRASSDELEKGIKFNKVSQQHLVKSKNIWELLLRESKKTF